MEELKQNKKKTFKRIFFSLLVVVLLISLVSLGGYMNYREDFKEQQAYIEKQVEENGWVPKDIDGLPNPRMKIRNSSGHEVIGLDHEGTGTFEGNITATNSNNGYGFFQWIGSQASIVTKGWFSSLNTTNITSTKYCNSTACYSINQFFDDTTIDTWATNLSAQSNCPTGNYSYGMLTNGSLLCRNDVDTNTNCSTSGSCASIAYLNYSNSGHFNLTGAIKASGMGINTNPPADPGVSIDGYLTASTNNYASLSTTPTVTASANNTILRGYASGIIPSGSSNNFSEVTGMFGSVVAEGLLLGSNPIDVLIGAKTSAIGQNGAVVNLVASLWLQLAQGGTTNYGIYDTTGADSHFSASLNITKNITQQNDTYHCYDGSRCNAYTLFNSTDNTLRIKFP